MFNFSSVDHDEKNYYVPASLKANSPWSSSDCQSKVVSQVLLRTGTAIDALPSESLKIFCMCFLTLLRQMPVMVHSQHHCFSCLKVCHALFVVAAP